MPSLGIMALVNLILDTPTAVWGGVKTMNLSVRLINVPSPMFTAPSGFPGPNISVYLTLHVYLWVMPVVPSRKMIRLRGPSYQSLSSFHLLPTLVLLLYYFFSYLFFSHFFSFSCFFSLLLSVPRYHIPPSSVARPALQLMMGTGGVRCVNFLFSNVGGNCDLCRHRLC